jgi:hypothetical protein
MLLAAHQQSQAAELRWNSRPFQIVANEKPLPDFLRELASSQNVTAVIDPKVAGVISGKFAGPALTILNSVCSVNGLTWYFDGAFLFVDLAADAKSEVLPIAAENASRIAETLVRLHISDERYPLSISERDASVYVTGPRRYVEMVRQAVKLADQRTAMAEGAEIRLFPLKYAWASDFKINRSGKETVIPGRGQRAAQPLRPQRQCIGHSGGRAPSAPFSVGANRQIKLRSGETITAPKIEMAGMTPNAETGGGIAGPSIGNELPQFQADTRMNAVLVRDMPDRMAQYTRLIEAMDVKPRLVEIEVTIMDISSDTLSSLGIDWRLHGRHGDFQIGPRRPRAPDLGRQGSEAGQVGGLTAAGLADHAAGRDVHRRHRQQRAQLPAGPRHGAGHQRQRQFRRTSEGDDAGQHRGRAGEPERVLRACRRLPGRGSLQRDRRHRRARDAAGDRREGQPRRDDVHRHRRRRPERPVGGQDPDRAAPHRQHAGAGGRGREPADRRLFLGGAQRRHHRAFRCSRTFRASAISSSTTTRSRSTWSASTC